MQIDILDESKFLCSIDSINEWNLFSINYIQKYIIDKMRLFYSTNILNVEKIHNNSFNKNIVRDNKEFNGEINLYFGFLSDFIIHNFSDVDLSRIHLFLELVIVSESDMKDLNKQYMQKDYATDVLSFPLEIYNTKQSQCIGSIVINMNEVYNKARFYNHNIYAEFSLLFIHAMLHLIGFDHEKDNGEHTELENNIISDFRLPNSLIQRVTLI